MRIMNESTMIMSEPRICAWCGKEFIPDAAAQLYCCREHSRKAQAAQKFARRNGMTYTPFPGSRTRFTAAEAKKLAEQGDTRTIKEIVIQGRKEHRSYGDVAGDYYRALMHLDLEQKLMRWR